MEPRNDVLALNVVDVVKSYGNIRALDGVSIAARPGEFVALLGPNGAGKTTLFQLLTGLFVPDSGKIEVDGHDIRRNAVPALGSLGIVFQTPTLDPELSIISNLKFHTNLHGLTRSVARQRIEYELKRFDLTDRAGDPVRNLSGGNKRRVELARSLLHEPKILLMDEPTVGLDPKSRRDILRMVLTLRKERGIAVLWASHLVDEAEQADRIVVLHKGKVLVHGSQEDTLAAADTSTLNDAFFKLTREQGAEEEAA